MAKRLIDAEALWHRLEAEPWYDNADRDEVALPLVDDAPTVDAVEVCYCKDCKYWEKQKDSAQGCCVLSGNYPTGGWYCADGKRRREND